MKKIVFISGPMTGLPSFNYHSFQVAEIWLRSQGFEVRNPAIYPHDWTIYEDYMSLAMTMLDQCTHFVQLPGWEKSTGARREMQRSHGLKQVKLHLPLHLNGVLLEILEGMDRENPAPTKL